MILVQGLYKDEVLDKVIELSRTFNMEFINAENCKTFNDFFILLNNHPDAIIYNTWIDLIIKEKQDCVLQLDETAVLTELVRHSGGFAYYLTSTEKKLLKKFSEEDVKNYDYMMVQMKMSLPIIAYNCDPDVEPINVEIS